jgi:hypothetical protein
MIILIIDDKDAIMFGLATSAQIADLKATLITKLNDIAAVQSTQFAAILKQGTKIMATLDDITAKVAAQTTIEDSLLTLMQELKDQITALPGLTAAQQAQVDQIFSDLSTNNDRMANAVTANTPATPPSP